MNCFDLFALQPGPERGDVTGGVRHTCQQKFGKLWLINIGIKLNFWPRSLPIPGSLMPREECPRWLPAYEQKWAFLKGLSIGSFPGQLFVSLLSSKGVGLWGLFGFLVGFFGLVAGVWFFIFDWLDFLIFWPLAACGFIRRMSKIVSFVSSSCELPSHLPHCFREKEPEKGCLRFFFLSNWKWEKSWEFLSTAVLSQSIRADWEPKVLCTQLQPCISCHCPRWNLPSPAAMIHFQNFS